MMDLGTQIDVLKHQLMHFKDCCCCLSVFPSQASNDESSSDETGNQSSPTVRKRRARKRLVSSSEAEGASPAEPESEPPKEEQHKHQFGSGLNRCIILALVVAISMGFGHFYGEFIENKMHNRYRFIVTPDCLVFFLSCSLLTI